MAAATFDKLAGRYDELWTSSPIGKLQRTAVWRHIEGLFEPGDTVLELGCGTGEDALQLMNRGIHVHGIDCSPEMVRIACARGVDARTMAIEDVGDLRTCFDGAISNFGAINCVENLSAVRGPLARLIRPGGWLAICTMGRFCLWEMAYFLWRLQLRKAVRRWAGRDEASSLNLAVFYRSVQQMSAALRPDFDLVKWCGVGVCVPPSYVAELSASTLARLASVDRSVAHWPVLRGLSDHRLLVFVRTQV